MAGPNLSYLNYTSINEDKVASAVIDHCKADGLDLDERAWRMIECRVRHHVGNAVSEQDKARLAAGETQPTYLSATAAAHLSTDGRLPHGAL